MDRKTVLVAIAALLFAVAMIAGFTGLSSGGSDCGSVLGGGGDAAQSDLGDRIVNGAEGSARQDACRDAEGDRRVITFGALGLAVLAGVIAVAVKEDAPRSA